jgi:pilus assembly protein Flp/PilA
MTRTDAISYTDAGRVRKFAYRGGLMCPRGESARMLDLLMVVVQRSERHEEGQGMVEYGLIIAAVALAVIVALFALGPKIGSMFSSVSTSMK